MFPSYLLSLREGLEAALLIGIMLGALQKINRRQLSPFVWRGAFLAVAVSIITAAILYRLGASLEGNAEKVFEGITMLLAAGVLTGMIFWMQRQSQLIKNTLERDVRIASMGNSGKYALFVLSFVVVVREGVELALFLTAATFTSTAQDTFTGAVLGMGTAVLLGWSLFATVVKLDLRRFFQVTGVILILFAAGLVAHGVHEFNEVGLIPPIIEHVWDINFIIDEGSNIGLFLKTIFGYNGNPSLSELLAYITYFVIVVLVLFWNSSQQSALQKT